MALGIATACAGERETFDFGWQFKYFGSGDPSYDGAPAAATSVQNGHSPMQAIDGNPNTRWCAANAKSGHKLMINTGFNTKIKTIEILWEKADGKDITVSYTTEGKRRETKFKADTPTSTISVGGKPVSHVEIKVEGTTPSSWASIREVSFIDTKGDRVQPVTTGKVVTPASPAYKKLEGFKKVQLPHDWAIESPFLVNEPNETGKLPWNGYGWYRKSFDIPADFDADTQRYYLDFEGVMANPQVYVNGKKAGEWAYGYNSFRVDITPFLKAGEKNLVAVMASNKPNSTRWYPGAGIYRHVWLEKTGPVHLANWGVYATTPEVSEKSATVKVETTVENTGKKPAVLTVQQELSGHQATPVQVSVAPGCSQTVTQEIKLPDPKLWSCESPYLYQLNTSVQEGKTLIDSKSTTIGVRQIEWKPDGFYLNGKRVQINGV